MLDHPMKFGVGQPMRRLEDDRFLRGAGRYVDDITLPNQVYAYFLRSPFAHAILNAVDVAAAREAPGVVAVLTQDDVAAMGVKPLGNRAPLTNADGSDIAPVKMPHLAQGRVRFVGQPIAMVVAETRAAARDAAELIELDADELPAVTDAEAALRADAPELHGEAPGNLSYDWALGDPAATEAAFADAAHRITLRVRNQRVIVNAIEPRAFLADYDAELERWTFHSVSQGAFGLRNNLAADLGVPIDAIRVITPDVGGGFGMKLMVHPEYAVIAGAARKLGRPVKWTADRSESFLSDAQGRDVVTDAEGAFAADGALLAMRFTNYSNLGAYYSQVGAAVHSVFSGKLAGGIYRMPAGYVTTKGAFTNTTPTDAYRGAGRPEMLNVTERLMDEAAHQLGVSPVEIRRRNLLTPSDAPYQIFCGPVIDSADCVANLEKTAAAADLEGFEARRAADAARGRARGLGVTYYIEHTGGGPIENARIRIRGNGRIDAWIGTQSTGQGHETAWAQLLHHKLGVDPSVIDFPPGDSDLLPAGGGTGGSRSLVMAHRCFFIAADDVIAKGKALAADRLEAAVGDIEFSPDAGGQFRIAGTDRAIDLFLLAAGAEEVLGEAAILGEGGVTDRQSTYPNGCHIAEISVDLETGAAALERFTVVDDFGVILNPLLVAGQVHGGVAQGVGQALLEGAAWDAESGQPLTGSYMDYQMPRAADLPMLDTALSETAPSTTNPLGVKGCGEAGAVGATPAVMAALLNALRPHGVRDLDMPATPRRIWEALQAARG